MLDASYALAIAPVALAVIARALPKTCNYELRHGPTVVYQGISNDVSRRVAEHRRDGKLFTNVRVTHWSFFRFLARRREILGLEQYRRAHGGSNPRYNRRDAG
jgi:hypothetical protein